MVFSKYETTLCHDIMMDLILESLSLLLEKENCPIGIMIAFDCGI